MIDRGNFRPSVFLWAALVLAGTARADNKNWTAATIGYWTNPVNWVESAVPNDGDDVFILNGGNAYLTSTSAALNSITISNTLTFTNWNSVLRAATVTILAGGVMTLPPAFTNNQMSNNICIECTNLFIAQGGKIDANARGYAGGGYDPTYYGQPGNGPGYGRTTGWDHPSGAGHGGKGGDGGINSLLAGGSVYDTLETPIQPGSGGAGGASSSTGGNGGGAVFIQAGGTVTINGTITANSGTGSGSYGGGGSGGAVYIECNILAGTNGVISADGGNSTGYAGSGGGGRIAVNYNPLAQGLAPVPVIRFSAMKGAGTAYTTWLNVWDRDNWFGNWNGQLGTLSFPDARLLTENITLSGILNIANFTNWAPDHLTISNAYCQIPVGGFCLSVTNDLILIGNGNNTALELTNATVTCGGDLTISNATLTMLGNSTGMPTLIVNGNLVLHDSPAVYYGLKVYAGMTNSSTLDQGALVDVAQDVSVGSNAWIYSSSQWTNGGSPLFRARNFTLARKSGMSAIAGGFQRKGDGTTLVNGLGYGYGYGDPGVRSTGAGHGGQGGIGNLSSVGRGITYGESNAPLHAGSSGGGAGGLGRMGAKGGGVIHIEAKGVLTVNGAIRADGGVPGPYGGGGSGGSIYLRCLEFAGDTNGILQAKGSDVPDQYSGPGGGGRIAVYRPPSHHKYQGLCAAPPGTGGYTNTGIFPEAGTVVMVDAPESGTLFSLK